MQRRVDSRAYGGMIISSSSPGWVYHAPSPSRPNPQKLWTHTHAPTDTASHKRHSYPSRPEPGLWQTHCQYPRSEPARNPRGHFCRSIHILLRIYLVQDLLWRHTPSSHQWALAHIRLVLHHYSFRCHATIGPPNMDLLPSAAKDMGQFDRGRMLGSADGGELWHFQRSMVRSC
jgi:hypothetical protein